jgi:hypothetical protein
VLLGHRQFLPARGARTDSLPASRTSVQRRVTAIQNRHVERLPQAIPRTLDRHRPVHLTLLAVAGLLAGLVVWLGAVTVARAAAVTHPLGRRAPATRIATASTYTLRSGDHGASFRVVVTATDGIGSADAYSGAIGPVQ